MSEFFANRLFGFASIAMMAFGGGLAIYLGIAMPNGPLTRWWNAYVKILNEYVRFLLIRKTGTQIARIQVLVVGILLVLAILTLSTNLFILCIAAAVAPWAILEGKRRKRIEQLELQLDSWLLMLSNALKATPAIGEAILSTVNLVRAPIREEIDLLVKENQLGTPVDRAVLNASERMQSPIISGALATIVIARQTGGDLSRILETTASTLREAARLEGVVRTKTSEGKSQTVFMALAPIGMAAALYKMDPKWMDPLFDNFIGNLFLAAAICSWLGAIFWAREILDVDI